MLHQTITRLHTLVMDEIHDWSDRHLISAHSCLESLTLPISLQGPLIFKFIAMLQNLILVGEPKLHSLWWLWLLYLAIRMQVVDIQTTAPLRKTDAGITESLLSVVEEGYCPRGSGLLMCIAQLVV